MTEDDPDQIALIHYLVFQRTRKSRQTLLLIDIENAIEAIQEALKVVPKLSRTGLYFLKLSLMSL
jgi:hypothetical protein